MIQPGTVFQIDKALLDTYYDLTDVNTYDQELELAKRDRGDPTNLLTDQETMKAIRNLNWLVPCFVDDVEWTTFVNNSIPYSEAGRKELWAQIAKNLPITDTKKYREVLELWAHRLGWSPTKVVVPKSVELMKKTQKITYLKPMKDEKGYKYFIFEYDGAVMRFGERFISFLHLCRRYAVEGFAIDNTTTYDNVYYKKHEARYDKAVEDAKALQKERREINEQNADVLAKYMFPTQYVRARYDWRFFLSLPWILIKNVIFHLTPKRRKQ